MGQWRTIVCSFALCATGAPLLSQSSIALLSHERSMLATDAGTSVAQPATSLEEALRAAFASAGVIFTGEVVSIDRGPGTVTVRWRVEDAVRGVAAGAVFEQREWGGLWADGNARYNVGERALVLLHAPSVCGYASPVADGVVPLRGDATTGTLDLRWMAKQVAVTDAARLRPMMALRAAGGDLELSDGSQSRAAQVASAQRAPGLLSLPASGSSDPGGNASTGVAVSTSAPADDANAHVDGAMVVSMLHAWQRAAAAGR